MTLLPFALAPSSHKMELFSPKPHFLKWLVSAVPSVGWERGGRLNTVTQKSSARIKFLRLLPIAAYILQSAGGSEPALALAVSVRSSSVCIQLLSGVETHKSHQLWPTATLPRCTPLIPRQEAAGREQSL